MDANQRDLYALRQVASQISRASPEVVASLLGSTGLYSPEDLRSGLHTQGVRTLERWGYLVRDGASKDGKGYLVTVNRENI